MDILVFLFGVWFNPMAVTQLAGVNENDSAICVIHLADGKRIVANTTCDDAAYDINRAYR